MQTFYPGVYFKEVEFGGSARAIDGIDMSIGALVGYFEKGPIGVPTKVTEANASEIFGGPIPNAFGWYAMDGFFKNGGAQLYVTRIAHYTDVTDKTTCAAISSSVKLKDRANATPVETIEISAKNEGVWGDKIGIMISDDNLVNTELMEAVEVSATTMKLKSVFNVFVGTKLFVADDMITVTKIDSVTRIVAFTPALTKAAIVKANIHSAEFKIDVYYNDSKSPVESFGGLSVDPLEGNYFETVVNDEGTGSAYISVNDLASVTAFPKNIPAVTVANAVKLSNGDDGLTGVGDTDIIGDKMANTGMYSFDYIQEAFNLFAPESCSENVKRAMYQYCELRMDAFGIGSIPEGYTADMAISYRLETGNFNTSYGALYNGWGYVNDPIGVGSNPQKLVPLDGHIAGMYSRHDRQFDIGEVPAGETAQLMGVNKLENNIDDITNGNLNKVNINCIRSLSGAGIVVWGARTLSSDTNWRYINARRIFIYVEKSVALGTRWAVFKPSNESTWKSIKRTVESFLNTVPGLYGESAAERYAVICDATTNPEAVRKSGQIITKIGLSIQSIGEFIIFEIGQMSEGVSITE